MKTLTAIVVLAAAVCAAAAAGARSLDLSVNYLFSPAGKLTALRMPCR